VVRSVCSSSKRVEDAAVEAAIRLQEDAGLAVVTDGEMRRLSFQSQLTEAVEGFGDWDLDAFLGGDWHGEEVGNKHIDRPPLAVLGRLWRRRFLSAEEFVYVRGRTQRIVKVTLLSPRLFANVYGPQRSRGGYPALESFLIVRLGCEYIQLDAPHYPLLLDPLYRDFYASRGWPAERWLDLGLELDNIVCGQRPGVTFGFHLCRGNQQSRWLAAVPPDRPSSSGSSPPRRDGRKTIDGLETRIRQAARHVPLERLALSPQCGFATSILGNALTAADEKAKLRTIVCDRRARLGMTVLTVSNSMLGRELAVSPHLDAGSNMVDPGRSPAA
jgi:5-methyltetrahydropteroyltriglutamate--homocysteine methyltransferase